MRFERFFIAIAVLGVLCFGVVEDPSARVGIIILILAGYGFDSGRQPASSS